MRHAFATVVRPRTPNKFKEVRCTRDRGSVRLFLSPFGGHPKSIPPEADSNQINRANLELEQREQCSGVEGLFTRRFFASV